MPAIHFYNSMNKKEGELVVLLSFFDIFYKSGVWGVTLTISQ